MRGLFSDVIEQWFSTFLHQRTGKNTKHFYGPVT